MTGVGAYRCRYPRIGRCNHPGCAPERKPKPKTAARG